MRFSEPREVLRAERLEEVLPALERAVDSGCYVAGFVGYEAAGAFDEALVTRAVGEQPLLLLGLFDAVERLDVLPEGGDAGWSVGSLRASVSEREFEAAIGAIKEQIAAGATYQVNYSYRLRGAFEGDAYEFFRSLVAGQEASHAAFVGGEGWSVCSASPELFFELKGGVLMSRPMKGTARRGRSVAEDGAVAEALRGSEKDRAENIMIVDMIRNDIGRVAERGSVEVVDTFALERYPTVWQMTSTVRGRCSAGVLEVFEALFPCASITGAPKVKTMELIGALESEERGVYTGAVGYWTPGGEALFNVAIRTAMVNEVRGELTYGVGGGIVWDSDAASEYAETLAKAEVLLGERPVFDLLETVGWTPEGGWMWLEEHLNRMEASAAYFGRAFDRVEAAACLRAAAMGEGALRLRLMLDEGGAFSVERMPLLSMGVEGEPLRVRLASAPVDSGCRWLYHKTTHRAVYAAAEAERVTCDEVVLWNERGEITEGTIFNVAVERDGVWVTPPVSCGLLGGVLRGVLLERGELVEGMISVEELRAAKRFRLFNSVRGVRDAGWI